MDKDEVSELAARIVERDGLSASGESRTTEEIARNIDGTQEKFEEEMGLTAHGWKHFQQLLDPKAPYGGSATVIRAVGEAYTRNRETLESLVFWWVGPESIGKVVLNGKEYPHPTPEVIRMLVR
jgi:hypothetical protein